jgi:hypothetical protein
MRWAAADDQLDQQDENVERDRYRQREPERLVQPLKLVACYQ